MTNQNQSFQNRGTMEEKSYNDSTNHLMSKSGLDRNSLSKSNVHSPNMNSNPQTTNKSFKKFLLEERTDDVTSQIIDGNPHQIEQEQI